MVTRIAAPIGGRWACSTPRIPAVAFISRRRYSAQKIGVNDARTLRGGVQLSELKSSKVAGNDQSRSLRNLHLGRARRLPLSHLLSVLQSMSPDAFERLAQRILR